MVRGRFGCMILVVPELDNSHSLSTMKEGKKGWVGANSEVAPFLFV